MNSKNTLNIFADVEQIDALKNKRWVSRIYWSVT